MRRALLLLPSLLVLACGGDPSAPALEVGGVGEDGVTFAPLSGDQPLVPGSQGGFHVWVKLRIHNPPPGRVKLERSARRQSDDRLVLSAQSSVELGEPSADGAFELPDPIPSFMCPTPIGVNVRDEEIRFEVRLVDDQDQLIAEDFAVATPRCPSGDHAAFCQDICSG